MRALTKKRHTDQVELRVIGPVANRDKLWRRSSPSALFQSLSPGANVFPRLRMKTCRDLSLQGRAQKRA